MAALAAAAGGSGVLALAVPGLADDHETSFGPAAQKDLLTGVLGAGETARIVIPIRPGMKLDVTVTANGDTPASGLTATLTWDAPGGTPVSYEIRRDGGVIGTTNLLTFDDNTLVADETYDYQVQALDDLGNPSGWSGVLTLTADCANGFDASVTPLVI